MPVTPTAINTHEYLSEIIQGWAGANKNQVRMMREVRPESDSWDYAIENYPYPAPLGWKESANRSIASQGDSKVVVFHEDGQMVNLDSYDGMDIDFYSLNVTTNPDIHMHYWFDGTGPYLGSNNPIILYQEDPANRNIADCSALSEAECITQVACGWDTNSSTCKCDDTNYTDNTSCPASFEFKRQWRWFVPAMKTLPYIMFIRGDAQIIDKIEGNGSYNISSTILDEKIDKVDPAGWDFWEVDPYAGQVRPHGIPGAEDTMLKTMAGYKTVKQYNFSMYRDEVSGKMTHSIFKHMADWKQLKTQPPYSLE